MCGAQTLHWFAPFHIYHIWFGVLMFKAIRDVESTDGLVEMVSHPSLSLHIRIVVYGESRRKFDVSCFAVPEWSPTSEVGTPNGT